MPAEAERVLAALKAWGDHATSFQILEPGYFYWFDDDVISPGAVVAWVRAGRFRVAAGAPIAPPKEVGQVAARFVADARAAGDRVLFFSADDAFLNALKGAAVPYDSVPIGAQPEWDPRQYHSRGKERRSLREQVNRARNKGVTVRTVQADEMATRRGALRAEIETVLDRWLESRRMSAMTFLVDLRPFHCAEERRYFVAEQGDRAVGFLAAIPVYQRNGWFFEDIIRTPDAPNGTVEALVDTAMRHAAEQGDSYVTLGLAPLAGIPEGPGPHRRMRSVLSWCYRRLGGLYQFTGVHAFKQRFRPQRWQPQYLVQCPPELGVGAFHAVLGAFAGGGLVSFGLDTLRRLVARVPRRVWAAGLYALAALLIPWTILLWLADGAYWFGDESIQMAWVAFDSALVGGVAGLGHLVQRGHRHATRLAIFLAGATLTDFVLTAVQTLYLHAYPTGATLLFLLLGVVGPFLATVFLIVLSGQEIAKPQRGVT